MSQDHYFDSFFISLNELDKQEVLQEASVPDDRPPGLRRGGDMEPAYGWLERHRDALVPALFRSVGPDDDEIAYMVQDGAIRVAEIIQGTPVRLRVSIAPDVSAQQGLIETGEALALRL